MPRPPLGEVRETTDALAWLSSQDPRDRIFGCGQLGAGDLAWAQVTFNVNTTADGVDINPLDSICSTVPPPAAPICTLRAAVMQANRMPNPGSIIKLPPGTYTLTFQPPWPMARKRRSQSGHSFWLQPRSDHDHRRRSRKHDHRRQRDRSRTSCRCWRSVSISGVSIVNGLVQAYDGGGISNYGNLILSDSIVRHNYAVFLNSRGGFATASRSIRSRRLVTFSDNHAGGNGGGSPFLLPALSFEP